MSDLSPQNVWLNVRSLSVGANQLLVLGFIARKEIQTSGGTQGGGGMAIAGIVLGALSVVLSIVLTILYFAGVVTYNFDASTTGY